MNMYMNIVLDCSQPPTQVTFYIDLATHDFMKYCLVFNALCY